jgi:DNA-binding YbaB/EbfC family protein
MKNLGQIMKQAQEMQSRMQEAQDKMGELEITGESGGGMVKVVLSGRYQAHSVEIDPSLLAEDRDMLEDLIAAAINDAVRRVEATQKQKMSEMAQGLGLPPGVKLPF